MDCQWTALLNILPAWLRAIVSQTQDKYLQEIRLRVGCNPTLVCKGEIIRARRPATKDDLEFCINTASRYSPWAHQSMANGFIAVQGGHRIGICGTVIVDNGVPMGIRDVSSLCIRVARQFTGIGERAAHYSGNILILGRPGSGKTTLLRDIIRCKSQNGMVVCVVDERQELFPCVGGVSCFQCGENTDIISGCRKADGIEMAIRLMNPDVIAVDEITANRDCDALINAGWCGISLLATAHAASKMDFLVRPIYRPLVESRLFDTLLILHEDKSWRLERVRYDD